MPIHDQSYRRYRGKREDVRSAWTVIAITGITAMLRKRAFLGVLFAAWIPPLDLPDAVERLGDDVVAGRRALLKGDAQVGDGAGRRSEDGRCERSRRERSEPEQEAAAAHPTDIDRPVPALEPLGAGLAGECGADREQLGSAQGCEDLAVDVRAQLRVHGHGRRPGAVP